jgi:hypothetical protein
MQLIYKIQPVCSRHRSTPHSLVLKVLISMLLNANYRDYRDHMAIAPHTCCLPAEKKNLKICL